jgi:hypothetical protein
MRLRFLTLSLLLVIAVAAGTCWWMGSLPRRTVSLLRTADVLQVFSLDPGREVAGSSSFHGWAVLGTVTIVDRDRKSLIDSIVDGVAPPGWRQASCFDPRHGVRAISKNGTVDLVICFECSRIEVFYSGGGKDELIPKYSLYKHLSETLTKAGIPIAATMSEQMPRR